MSKGEWGEFHDPDTARGMQAYEDAGLMVHSPEDIRDMSTAEQLELAYACGDVLDRVYSGKYPLSVGDAENLVASVEAGETHLFALTSPDVSHNAGLVAMAAVVDKPNSLGGEVRFSELGRSVADPDHRVSARALLKNRVPWTFENRPQTDMLYSVTRSAGAKVVGAPSGKGVQGVWWGSRARGGNIPFVTTNCGYDYRINGLEPFNGFTIPTNPEAWLKAAANQRVVVPHTEDAYMLRTILEEGTNGRLMPNIVVAPRVTTSDVNFHEVSAGEPVVTDKYLVTNVATRFQERDQSEVDAELGDSINQKVILEADVAGTMQGAATMRTLEEEGWTLCGWQPSELVYGGICPVYTRINPAMVDQIVEPGLHPENFDRGGLGRTREVLGSMYIQMYERAALAAAEQNSTVVV